jgi:hypothetical protein
VREKVKEGKGDQERKKAIAYKEGKGEFGIPRLHFRIAKIGDMI